MRTEGVIVVRTKLALIVATVAVTLAATPAIAAEDTVGLVDPATGEWRLRNAAGNTFAFYYGNPGDIPFAGDWDCDGVDTPGLYRQVDGYVYLRNSNSEGVADLSFFFGDPGDLPIAGDFDGDGCDTVSVYRPAEGRVYIIDELGSGDAGLGAATTSYYFGNPGDSPFTGDFDGDGDDTVGLYRETTGFVYFRNSHTQGIADDQFYFGDPGDRFVGGDWTNAGFDSPGVFRPSTTRFYLKYSNTEGIADEQFPYGTASMLPVAGQWGNIPAVPDLALQVVATGLSAPIAAAAPPGDDRLFVAERNGTIKVLENGAVLQTPFLFVPDVDTEGEGGLLGLVFHPNFATNGRFFVHYTADGIGSNPLQSRVVEYYADPASDVAAGTPVRTILTLDQPRSNHNAGALAFGPDGYLYIPFGDGGDDADEAQDPTTWLGSLLRIDVDGGVPYAIPPGNPYNGTNGAREVYATGLRNPWRMSIDDNGDIYIGDVGSSRFEEVNVVPAGAAGLNFGWPIMEGGECRVGGCNPAGLTTPVVDYPYGSQGRSVVAGHVYRGSALPHLDGTFFYSDFFGGWLRSFRLASGIAVEQREWPTGNLAPLSSIGEGGDGELYITSFTGTVYKIVAG